jgi:hypothetical protein
LTSVVYGASRSEAGRDPDSSNNLEIIGGVLKQACLDLYHPGR